MDGWREDAGDGSEAEKGTMTLGQRTTARANRQIERNIDTHGITLALPAVAVFGPCGETGSTIAVRRQPHGLVLHQALALVIQRPTMGWMGGGGIAGADWSVDFKDGAIRASVATPKQSAVWCSAA
ncbi:unnamed protein product [Clonostachys rosea]|uniref:Uncharacterized protein n=1 Tax=Bionectria ochroleuca TaxID=29856 RepID=A0ABY6TSD5_BIOOC|nr:unnamed protein product [Clonostachys rosea]